MNSEELYDKFTESFLQAVQNRNAEQVLHLIKIFDQVKESRKNLFFGFSIFLTENIFEMTNGNFIRKKPVKNKDTLSWLEDTIGNSHLYIISLTLARANLAQYEGRLDEASSLLRKAFFAAQKINAMPQMKEKYSMSSMQFRWAMFAEPYDVPGEKLALPDLQLPDSLKKWQPAEQEKPGYPLFTAYGNAPYFMRYAERFITGAHSISSDIHILLVIGDPDDDTSAYAEKLQGSHPHLHIAHEQIPQQFNNEYYLHTYCSLRRFTYLHNIFDHVSNLHLLCLDLDLFLHPLFRKILDDIQDAPISYRSDIEFYFSADNLFSAGYWSFRESALMRKFIAVLDDYLRKKLYDKDIVWMIDQYALFYAWQHLSEQEKSLCRNMADCDDDNYQIGQLHKGYTQSEQQAYKKDRSEKEKDNRFYYTTKIKKINIDPKTLKPRMIFL